MASIRYIVYRFRYPYCESPLRAMNDNLEDRIDNYYCYCNNCDRLLGLIDQDIWILIYVIFFYIWIYSINFFILLLLSFIIIYSVFTILIVITKSPQYDYIIGA